ncbi:MAG: aminoacyl-tRNA hydrolase [Anaerolineaceae bacterium]|nr:aminoacyl-tRNA hydrolase [Anaerolineaceae bacterium]
MSNKYLIVGLGNPGRQYQNTRHNVGFWVVAELARRHNLSSPKSERKSYVLDGTIAGKRVIAAIPQTYMNLSGEAVRALVDFYKIPLENIIVVHDDLDTPLGTLRLRQTGGHGGQNGVRNIILHLGTQEFARVRFGIGRPNGKMTARDYVLQPFYDDDAILAEQVTSKAADAVEAWLAHGLDKAMSMFNGDINDTQTKPKTTPEDELKLARRAHELAPNDPKPLEKMAQVYRRLRQLDEAANAYLMMADVHARAARPKQQVAAWEQAVAIRPSLVDIQADIARAYEAEDNSKRATQRWLKLAAYYQDSGALEKAQQAIDEALRLNPQHPKALDMQAHLEQVLKPD